MCRKNDIYCFFFCPPDFSLHSPWFSVLSSSVAAPKVSLGHPVKGLAVHISKKNWPIMQQPKIDHNPLVGFDPIKQESIELLDPSHPLATSATLVGASNIPPVYQASAQVAPAAHGAPVAPPGASLQPHHGSNNMRPSYRHSGSFTGLAFHNPFDMNSYPITNPPILDSTVIPYGDLSSHRRRISISNGQIGQIVNHEAIFLDEDLLDDFNDLSPYMGNQNGSLTTAPDQRMFDVDSQPQSAQLQLLHRLLGHNPRPPRDPVVSAGQGHQQTGVRSQFQDNGHISALNTSSPQGVGSTEGTSPKSQDMAGVPPPNHQLIYNNEVIYNPNNGPIPGTAAWKKERLLERNRIAASKCRQRKKQAQQQLQDNISKSQKRIKDQTDRLQKYDKLFTMYNAALTQYFQTRSDASLDPLRGLIRKLIDDISFASLGM